MTLPYRVGDEIGLPPEPPAGSVLHAENHCGGGFEIERDERGWFQRGVGELIAKRWSWQDVYRSWGTQGTPLRVVELPAPPPSRPRRCENCEKGYDACTVKLRNTGRPCCGACADHSTHHQGAWERAYGPKLTSEVSEETPRQDTRRTGAMAIENGHG